MRTADRVLADGVQFAFRFSNGAAPVNAQFSAEMSAALRVALRSCPVLVADNVAHYVEQYVEARDGFLMESLPSVAPPWPVFWIEYPSASGRERRGVMVTDATRDDRTVDGAYHGAVQHAREDGYHGDIGWVLDLTLYIEDCGAHAVAGPIGWLVLALDPGGRIVGNRWVVNAEDPRGLVATAAAEVDAWMLRAFASALQTIAFLHCRNVVVDNVAPPPKLSHKHQRRHGRPLVRYKTIRLEVPRSRGPGGRGDGTGESPALHIVPGHFAHYGDCCPGQHPPNGLLFGKLSGIYWMPTHLRGNPRRGLNLNDYELVTGD